MTPDSLYHAFVHTPISTYGAWAANAFCVLGALAIFIGAVQAVQSLTRRKS